MGTFFWKLKTIFFTGISVVLVVFFFFQNQSSLQAATSYVGVSNLIATDGSAPGAITPNASTANGDLLVFYHYARATGGNETVTLPTGFTTIFNSVTADQGLVAVGWRIKQAGDTTFTASVTNHTTGGNGESILEWIETFRGADTVSPITSYTSTLSTWASSLNLGPVLAPPTTTVANGDAVVVFAGRIENITSQTVLSGDNLTWTTQTLNDTTLGRDAGAVTQMGVNASGSNQTITAKTITTSGSAQAGAGRMFIIKKASDTTAPTPNPMTFAAVPTNDSSSQISMTATTASDPSSPVSYLFTNDNSSCGANTGTGGTTSAWQTTTAYSDIGLQTNKCYGYTVTARDAAPTPNVGTASSLSSAYTSANTPGTPTLSGATTNSLNLTNAENGNPASNPTTNFAVQVVTTTDATWLNKWVDTTGNPSTIAAWMSDAQLDALTLHNLQSNTLYGVKVKARNQDNDETALSTEGQGTTSAPAPITTISNFVTSEPSNTTIAPSASGLVDSFGLQTTSGSDTVTGATVTLASGTGTRIATVSITNNGDTLTYCSNTPSGDIATLTGCGIPVSTTNTQFKIKITAISHAAMPAPPGGSYAVTATVTAFTSTNAQTGTDSGSATVTIDNLSPASATSASGSAGSAQVVLSWTTSASSDFSRSVMLRWIGSSAGSEVPTEGTDYSNGNTITTATVACVRTGDGSSTPVSGVDGAGTGGCNSTPLTNGQAYTYKIFQKDSNGNYDTGALVGTFTPSPTPTTTLGTGSDPSATTIAPGASASDVNYFTLQTNTSTETITSVTVNLSTNTGVALLSVTNNSNTVLGSTASPVSGSNTITVSGMTAGTSITTFKIRIAPLSHASMPAVPGASYAITAPVTAWAGSFVHTGSDTNTNTLIIDNLSPASATSASGSAGSTQVVLSWTNPADSDYTSQTVLRRAGSAVADIPTEGATYSVGNTIGTATVACVETAPAETCTDAGLTNGTAYYYKLFSKDSRGNYSSATTPSGAPFTPSLTTFTIISTAGSGGTISPLGSTVVAQGSSQTYTITPNLGYDIATLTVDGSSIATSTSYTFGNIQQNHTIDVTFVLTTPTYTITSSAGANGSISPLGTTVFLQGASQTYTITPTPGYYVDTLLVDAASVATSTSYTFTNISANHTISATFALAPPPVGTFAITATAGSNGSINPSGVTIVTQGNSQSYTIAPDSGYEISTLTVDGVSVAAATSYTFTNVQTNHTIDATFALLPVSVVIPDTGASRATTIIFSGKAFPRGIVSVVDKQLNTETMFEEKTVTKDDGSFSISFIGIFQALHSFGLLAKDAEGRVSQSKFFFINTISNDLVIKELLIPPTGELESRQVTRGDNAFIEGRATPNYTTHLELDGILIQDTLVNKDGVYNFTIPTGALEFGNHTIRIKQTSPDGSAESDFSTSRTLAVSRLIVIEADMNSDGKIDIRDWSIFLSLWGSKSTSAKSRVDFNKDGKVDISDFSIFIKTIRKK